MVGQVAKVARPIAKGKLLLIELDESVAGDEVITATAEAGDCMATEIKLDPIRPMRNGLKTVWLQCPIEAANKIGATRKIRLGWSMVKVVQLRSRPLQCFKCWRLATREAHAMLQ